MLHEHPVVKATLELTSIGVLVGYFFDHLPSIATGLTSTYYFLLIVDRLRKRK